MRSCRSQILDVVSVFVLVFASALSSFASVAAIAGVAPIQPPPACPINCSVYSLATDKMMYGPDQFYFHINRCEALGELPLIAFFIGFDEKTITVLAQHQTRKEASRSITEEDRGQPRSFIFPELGFRADCERSLTRSVR